MQFPVSIELHRSRHLSVLLILFHCLAAACVIALPWSWLVRLLVLTLIGWSLRQALLPSRIVGLRLSGHDGLDCLLTGDQRIPAFVLSDSTIFSQLIVLRLRIGEEERISQIALLADQMSGEQFRILRLWLRWHAEPEPEKLEAKEVE